MTLEVQIYASTNYMFILTNICFKIYIKIIDKTFDIPLKIQNKADNELVFILL